MTKKLAASILCLALAFFARRLRHISGRSARKHSGSSGRLLAALFMVV